MSRTTTTKMAEPCAMDSVDTITETGVETENRHGNCEVCSAKTAKYTCPSCELKTCSLDCVKIHKKELGCAGNRQVTTYVPLKKFDNLTLLSDYRFLEDVTRTLGNCQRNPLNKSTRYNKALPPHLTRLKSQAAKRNTQLQFLPQHFTRHKENTSFLHFSSATIFWKLELIFPEADNIKITIERCSENDRLSKILSQYMDFEQCPEIYRNHLKYYHSTGLAGMEILLKAENVNATPSFFLLDLSLSIKENLDGRIIIENPILYAIHKTHKEEYNILDDDLKWDFNVDQSFKKGKRFPNFSPYHYFDTVCYKSSKKNVEGEMAASSIHQSANELKKYFGFNGDLDEEDEGDSEEKTVPVLANKKPLYIPQYEDL